VHKEDLAIVGGDPAVSLVVLGPAHNPEPANATKPRPTVIQILGGQAELQFVDLHGVVDVEVPAPTRLAFAVHPHRHRRQKRLDLGTTVDHPFELEQLTEADRLTPDPYPD